jgi:hypothetical protein
LNRETPLPLLQLQVARQHTMRMPPSHECDWRVFLIWHLQCNASLLPFVRRYSWRYTCALVSTLATLLLASLVPTALVSVRTALPMRGVAPISTIVLIRWFAAGVFGIPVLVAEEMEGMAETDTVLCSVAAQKAYMSSTYSFVTKKLEDEAVDRLRSLHDHQSLLPVDAAGNLIEVSDEIVQNLSANSTNSVAAFGFRVNSKV